MVVHDQLHQLTTNHPYIGLGAGEFGRFGHHPRGGRRRGDSEGGLVARDHGGRKEGGDRGGEKVGNEGVGVFKGDGPEDKGSSCFGFVGTSIS